MRMKPSIRQKRRLTKGRALVMNYSFERKFSKLDLKRVDEDGIFEGYASVFGREDMGKDILVPGAFAKSLTKRDPRNVKLLFQHDPNQVIGVWQEIKEDRFGLFVKGQISTEVEKGREVLALMRAGALDGLSIGFRAQEGYRNPRTGIRKLVEVDLWEISIVTFPMLPEARVTHVKARPFALKDPTEREFERWLTRDAGLTRKEARAISRSGFAGLQSLRDAGGGKGGEVRLVKRIRDAAHLLSSKRPNFARMTR